MRIGPVFAASALALSLNACDKYFEPGENIPYARSVECAAVAALKIQESEQLFNSLDIDQIKLMRHNEILWSWRSSAERDAAFKGRDLDSAVTDTFHKQEEIIDELQGDDKTITRLSDRCARAYLPAGLQAEYAAYKL